MTTHTVHLFDFNLIYNLIAFDTVSKPMTFLLLGLSSTYHHTQLTDNTKHPLRLDYYCLLLFVCL